MREQYPFFRDADERTLGVLGEEAADADLKGNYEKPYAVLSDKRLYCKNEQGNFIADARTLRMEGRDKRKRPLFVLIAGLLMAALFLTMLTFGGGWGLLTGSTKHIVTTARKAAALGYNSYRNSVPYASSNPTDEQLEALTSYVKKGGLKEWQQAYDECCLDQLPEDREMRLNALLNAEFYLEALKGEQLEQLSEEQRLLQLADLAQKFEVERGSIVREASQYFVYNRGQFSEDGGTYVFGDGLTISPEGRELFIQLCNGITQAGGLNAYFGREEGPDFYCYQYYYSYSLRRYCSELIEGQVTFGDPELAQQYLDGTLDNQEKEDELNVQKRLYTLCGEELNSLSQEDLETLTERVRLLYQCCNALGGVSSDSGWSWYPQGSTYYYYNRDFVDYLESVLYHGDFTISHFMQWAGEEDLAALLVCTYLESAGDAATPDDLLNMLILSAEQECTPSEAIYTANRDRPTTMGGLTEEALTAITQYSAEERQSFLLPLSQFERENLESVYQSLETKLELQKLEESIPEESRYEYQRLAQREGVDGLKQLERSVSFAGLCTWAVLASAAALLAFYTLNWRKLAGLIGTVLGLWTALTGGVVFTYWSSYLPRGDITPFFLLAAIAFGLATAVLCGITLYQALKTAATPTFRLVTSTGVFTFREKNYSKEEREAFAAAIARGKGEA